MSLGPQQCADSDPRSPRVHRLRNTLIDSYQQIRMFDSRSLLLIIHLDYLYQAHEKEDVDLNVLSIYFYFLEFFVCTVKVGGRARSNWNGHFKGGNTKSRIEVRVGVRCRGGG